MIELILLINMFKLLISLIAPSVLAYESFGPCATPDLVEDFVQHLDGRTVAVLNKKKITRSVEHGIVSRPESKNYRVVYTKRVLLEDGTTLPYGYKHKRRCHPSTDDAEAPPSKKRRV